MNHAWLWNGLPASEVPVASPLARIITNEIYRVRTRTKRKPELKPSEIPSLLGYTARLTQVKWDRLKARRSHG